MAPTPTEQAEAFLAVEGLGERCGRIIADCISKLGEELAVVAAGGLDVRGHAAVIATELRKAADFFGEHIPDTG